MNEGPRRVVTGLDAGGRSCILIDDRRPIAFPGGQFVWRSRTSPADNSGNEDAGAEPFNRSAIHDREGSSFALFTFKPEDGLTEVGMHATDTIDYVVVLQGRIEFSTETGKVELAAGDLLVDRGVVHGWRAIGDEPAMTAVVMVPANPVGKGGTL
ncbi:MAG: cupin domain-containing protein [Sphingomonadaceae bacterium]|nr:cupin domain-containing protein [Sphingomonadaceae bacterium]